MRIAIETSGLTTGYRVQGTGVYIDSLLKSLEEYVKGNEYIRFSQAKATPRNVDLIHYPYFNPFFLSLPLQKPSPTVVTVHDLIPLVFPAHFPVGIKGTIKWNIQKRSVRRANRIIADSEASKKDIVELIGISPHKVDVVYLAAREEFKRAGKKEKQTIKKIRDKYQLPEKFALYVGDIIWSKNIPNLVRAVEAINVTLVMVGKQTTSKDFDKNHPWNKDLVFLNKVAEKDKKIVRLGFIPENDLAHIYNLATLFVMPSFYEGFGLPILEAMASGTPVVTTKGGSLAEVVGEAAYFVNPHDVTNIADGIGEVFFNQKLQKELAEKGIAQESKFSWRKTAEDTVRVYEKVLKK